MEVLYEYFAARDDASASAVLGHAAPGPVVRLGELDPAMGLLELGALLTGRSSEEALDDLRAGEVVAHDEGGGEVVVAVPARPVRALAGAGAPILEAASSRWLARSAAGAAGAAGTAVVMASEGERALLAGLLGELAGLARHAHERGEGVYCRVRS